MKRSIFALAMGTFGLGLSEFGMMGILPDIADDMGVTIPQAGHFISAYAVGVAVGAPLLAIATRRYPLKAILMMLMGIYIFGNLGFAASGDYGLNLMFRFISGIPHGAYFGVGSIVASRIADEGKGGAAVAGMVAGMTVANLFGVPLGTFISHVISWHYTYLFIGLVGVVILWSIRCWVPALAPLADTGFKGQFAFLKRPPPWLLIAAIVLGNGGIFCWYSYVNPLMTRTVGLPESMMTFVMMFVGMGMVLGNILGGRSSDRFTPSHVATTSQGLAAVLLLLIFLCTGSQALSMIMMFLCSGCLFAVSAPQQLLLLEHSKGGEMLGAACAQIAFNVGNAIGAYAGGIPIDRGYGYEFSALPGMAMTFVGFCVFMVFCNRYEIPFLLPRRRGTAGI